ncbi:hypothetical protein AX16_002828 [Volvariella volvacea WC 439]|nr:hypothetical protein AX16_002828 [Volvariella volvacea WC 439]
MITPRFTCSQTLDSVIISIYCPSVRASEVEIHVDDTSFSLHINPYFLRLNFSHPVLEDDASSAKYDPSSGYLTVTLTKETKGQEFCDLDLLAKLLAPKPLQPIAPIEVVSSTGADDDQEDRLTTQIKALNLDEERQALLEAEKNDWRLPQSTPEVSIDTSKQKTYGFLNLHSGYFRHVGHTENEVNELGADAETCTSNERQRRRIKRENDKWDPEYYMADFADDEQIQELLKWQHPHAKDTTPFEFSEAENATVLRLPRREYLATIKQVHELYLTLVTLLFSYAYECRTTQCDPTPESAWTLSVLTPAFSALDPPKLPSSSTDNAPSSEPVAFTEDALSATLVPSYRRCLAFPLYRSFALAKACQQDVARLLTKGKRTVVRCLLEIKSILDHHEVYYVYSKIWVDDFCVWTQGYASDDALISLGKSLLSLRVEKKSIGWELEELEAAAQLVQERAPDSDDE